MRLHLLLAALLAAPLSPAAAQELGGAPSVAGGIHVQSFRFQQGLGASAATLLLAPVAFQQPLGQRGLLELYASRATGTVRMEGSSYRLSAFTDSWLRTSFALRGNTVATVGLNLPTGHETHDAEEAVVATVLSTDLLGFREASWGMGFAATAGLSSFHRLGPWDLSYGASYRKNSAFEPRADTAVHYAPGDEVRLRLSTARTFAPGHTFAAGVMAMRYTHDRLDGSNLFQAGPRIMADASYAFPAFGGAWSVYATSVWRAQGQVTVPIVSQGSTVRTDSAYAVGRQYLVAVGTGGAVRLTRSLVLRPSTELRVQRGRQAGADGWMLSGGADLPLRFRRLELFPSARILLGALENREREERRATGVELSLVARLSAPSRR